MRYLFLYLVAAALVTAGVLSYHLHTARSIEYEKLATALADFLPEDTELNTYSLNDLRARYYAELHTIDPIFALAGTDTEALRTALKAFSISAEIARTPYKDSIHGEVLYPLALISRIADTEDARRTLLNNPTMEHARAYHTSLAATLTAYNHSLQKLENQLSINKSPTVAFWQGITDPDFIIDQIREAIAASNTRLETEHLRADCLSGKRTCPSLDTLRSEFTEAIPAAATPPPSAPSEARAYRYILDAHLPSFCNSTATEPLPPSTPDILLTSSRCTPNGGPTFALIATSTSRISSIPAACFYTTENIYLNNTHREQESGFLPPEPKLPEPYSYVIQPSNYYTCVDYGYDSQTAITLLKLRGDLRDYSLPENTDSELATLYAAANHLTQYPTIRDTDADTLAKTIASLYATHGSRWFIEQFGESKTRQLLDMVHTWNSRGANFDLTIGMMDDFMIPTLYAKRDGTPTIPPGPFFITHSNMVSLYQLANTTISSSTPSLLKIPNTPGNSFPNSFQGGIVSYESIKSRYPTIEDLTQAVRATEIYIRNVLLNRE